MIKHTSILSLALISAFMPHTSFAQDAIIEEDIESFEVVYLSNSSKSGKHRRNYDMQRHMLTNKDTLAERYANFKKALKKAIGLSYTLDASVLYQRGAPNGSKNAWQTQYYGSANWDMYESAIGAGSMQAAYTYVHYWGDNAQNISNRIGVVSAINDYTTNQYNFDQLTYTHTLPGKLNILSVSVGQFPMYNFDGSSYDANQQINFLNYSLSQNGSSSYPTASLGAYITLTPNSNWSFSVGFQDANNSDGKKIQTSTFHRKQYTSFVSISYTPNIQDMGLGQYSILLYNQPWTMEAPETTNGWSINIQQNINDKLSVFGRINGVTGNTEPISQSYVIGGVINNPLNRNELDQIGFATAINKLNRKVNGENSRAVETVFEGYWAWGISNFMTLTPDVQFYINPGQDKDNSHTATVFSLRATLMF